MVRNYLKTRETNSVDSDWCWSCSKCLYLCFPTYQNQKHFASLYNGGMLEKKGRHHAK